MKAYWFAGFLLLGRLAVASDAKNVTRFNPNEFTVSYKLSVRSEHPKSTPGLLPKAVPAYHGPVRVICGPVSHGEVVTGFLSPG